MFDLTVLPTTAMTMQVTLLLRLRNLHVAMRIILLALLFVSSCYAPR